MRCPLCVAILVLVALSTITVLAEEVGIESVTLKVYRDGVALHVSVAGKGGAHGFSGYEVLNLVTEKDRVVATYVFEVSMPGQQASYVSIVESNGTHIIANDVIKKNNVAINVKKVVSLNVERRELYEVGKIVIESSSRREAEMQLLALKKDLNRFGIELRRFDVETSSNRIEVSYDAVIHLDEYLGAIAKDLKKLKEFGTFLKIVDELIAEKFVIELNAVAGKLVLNATFYGDPNHVLSSIAKIYELEEFYLYIPALRLPILAAVSLFMKPRVDLLKSVVNVSRVLPSTAYIRTSLENGEIREEILTPKFVAESGDLNETMVVAEKVCRNLLKTLIALRSDTVTEPRVPNIEIAIETESGVKAVLGSRAVSRVKLSDLPKLRIVVEESRGATTSSITTSTTSSTTSVVSQATTFTSTAPSSETQRGAVPTMYIALSAVIIIIAIIVGKKRVEKTIENDRSYLSLLR